MIGLFTKENYIPTNKIDIDNLELIINRIKNIDNIFCKYSTKIYYEYYNIIHQNEIEDINVELKDYFKNNIVDINDDILRFVNNKFLCYINAY